MARYIDADELKKNINKREKWILELIDEQPTAVNMDEVVAETKDVFERLVAEILYKTGSKYTIVDFNLKPYADRVCDVVRKGGVHE